MEDTDNLYVIGTRMSIPASTGISTRTEITDITGKGYLIARLDDFQFTYLSKVIKVIRQEGLNVWYHFWSSQLHMRMVTVPMSRIRNLKLG